MRGIGLPRVSEAALGARFGLLMSRANVTAHLYSLQKRDLERRWDLRRLSATFHFQILACLLHIAKFHRCRLLPHLRHRLQIGQR